MGAPSQAMGPPPQAIGMPPQAMGMPPQAMGPWGGVPFQDPQLVIMQPQQPIQPQFVGQYQPFM
jgi:hypothetical protein